MPLTSAAATLEFRPHLGAQALTVPSRWLVCSDGLTDMVRDDVIEAMRMSVDADDPAGYVDALDRFYAIVMTIADNRTLQESHAGLIGPVRRLRRIAMARGGRMQASFSQTVRIRDAIVNQLPNMQDLMREQLDGACRAA